MKLVEGFGNNPYAGMSHGDLCGHRKDYARLLHAAVSARKLAERNLQLIQLAMQTAKPVKPEISDHAVLRFLERAKGVDIGSVRDEMQKSIAGAETLMGQHMRCQDGLIYCLSGEGHVKTVLPIGALINTAEQTNAEQSPRLNAKRRRAKRDRSAFIDAAKAMSASGQDQNGASAVGETDLPTE